MDILVKGMEMPSTCLSCYFHKCAGGVGDFCALAKKKQFRFKNRPSYCPLVPIPPHGDLIGRKAICLTDFEIAMCGGDYKEGMKMLLEKTGSAPTIIPAEEGE